MARSAPIPEKAPPEPAKHPPERGRLDVVATPIGNLGDLTRRAHEALAGADLIAAEDTRHTGQMLHALGISARLRSLHDYNESARIQQLIGELQAGSVVALVTDAGTPLLSDPGFGLVRAAAAVGITVRAIPGASALTAALSIAGLPTDRFAFEGFLPARAAARRTALAGLAAEPRTLVFFDAPHRIAATLEELAAMFGPERQAVIARELTKLHEAVYRGTLAQLAAAARADANIARGEITLVVAGAAGAADGEPAGAANGALLARALELLLAELPPARAAAIAAQLCGVPRSEAYALAQRLRSRRGD
ncbi:MAG TPA: 16S rRNA (cytidine(1402)-2'-O)-methyltransferase [Steroidobacteraceae bacterium]|nr:16S rRNA (cytidine(1402)-2'-O)-methyltransferase [Steroidobacteraceae bacterium]